MIFSLEALQAKQGDCLILHYGKPEAPGLIVIDGGPAGVYNQFLKGRLGAIRQSLVGADPLPVKMVMVSHADDDHINGILSMTNDLVGEMEDQKPVSLKVDNFWFNSFDDIIGNEEVVAAAMSKPAPAGADSHAVAVIASTGQGRNIRNNAKKLGWVVNSPFTALTGSNAVLVRGDTNRSKVTLGDLKLTVLNPDEQRLKDLQVQWDKDLKKAKQAGDTSVMVAALTVGDDTSPFNLSSIVCMAEFSGKRLLLTGDGRCDDIYAGLKQNGFLDAGGKVHVDVLKMPHHGSFHNMNTDFLDKVTADHYVISASGKYSNPDQETLNMMAAHVKKGTLHVTNHDGELGLKAKLDGFVTHLASIGSSLKVTFRDTAKPSLVINLLDKLPY
jgi:beta-lactamase superfamily II metal-dependent hydrolase